MKKLVLSIFLGVFMNASSVFSQSGGINPAMGQLFLLSDARTRSISPENFTGEKGKGGMSTDGLAAKAARDLGQGWKVSPYMCIFNLVRHSLWEKSRARVSYSISG
jgi:hypothetical protein